MHAMSEANQRQLQAVLDWEVVRSTPGVDGDPAVDVVVVAARRDMVSNLVQSLQKAGLRITGIDLSAFGMIRALAGDVHTAVGRDRRARR